MRIPIRSALVISTVAFATSHRPALAQSGLRVGLAGGVNVSTIKPQEGLAVRVERRTGLNAGGVATVGFGRLVTVETGIHFAQQGATLTSTDVTEDFVYDLELAYLQIPLLPAADGATVVTREAVRDARARARVQGPMQAHRDRPGHHRQLELQRTKRRGRRADGYQPRLWRGSGSWPLDAQRSLLDRPGAHRRSELRA